MKRKIQFLTIVLVLLFAGEGFAQITFQKKYGGANYEDAFWVEQTNDGGYIITGYTSTYTTGLYDIYLLKTNSVGDTVWTKTFGGTNQEEAYSVKQTSDGGYIIACYTGSFGAGSHDIYLIKTDNNGNLTWSKVFGGFSDDSGYSVVQTSDGGYAIVGNTVSFGFGSSSFYLVKTDANGNLSWTKTYGGVVSQYCTSVQQTFDGGYAIAGWTSSFGVGVDDFYLVKTDVSGNLLWSQTYGGAGTDYCNSMRQTLDGGYILTGRTMSFGTGSSDVYLVKTDSIGSLLWSKTFGGLGNDWGSCVQQTIDSGFIISAITASFGAGADDFYMLKTNSTGNLTWSKTYGGSATDQPYSLQQTSDKGYIITGMTGSFGASASDILLVKTDSVGNSGCNQTNPGTITTNPTTQVSSPTSNVSSGGSGTTAATLVTSGGSVNTICLNTGITEEIFNSVIDIFPNPSKGHFKIKFPNISKKVIKIFNVYGEEILSEIIFNSNEKEILIENISSGIYFVKVFDGEKSDCKKIIVE